MASKKKAESQKLWEERITRAKKKRADWAKEFRVAMSRDYYAGRQNPGVPDQEWITINKIYAHLQTQLPKLYSVDPYFYVKTKKSFSPDPEKIAEYDRRGKIRQAYLNYLKTELELKVKARLCIQDAYFAYGIAKTHFLVDQKENPYAGQEMMGEDKSPLLDDSGSPMLEPDEIPVNDRYAITRVHPDDFLWDDDAGPLQDKWTWVAERLRYTKDEAEKIFGKKVLKTLKPGKDDRREKNSGFTGVDDKGKDKDVYICWEIYDLKNNQWLKIAEDADAPLMEAEDLPPGVEDHPYSVLRFTLRDDDPYPIPPVSQAIDPQKEFCQARSQVLVHRKRFNRKYEVMVSKLTNESELSKLEIGDDGTCIQVQASGAVTPINDAPLDPMRYQELMFLNNDLVEIFGNPDEARAIASADSATQADIMDRRLEIREGDRLSMVVEFLSTIARKLDQLVQVHISKDEAVRITGPQGESWENVKVDDYQSIEGEFEYSVNVGATSPRLPQTERAQWTAFMSQVVIPMPHILTAPHFMKKMAEMFGIEDDAMLEELRQLGLQMMSGQVPMPGGGSGSQAGVPESNPVSAMMGQAMGALGGNQNGGGAPGGAMNG